MQEWAEYEGVMKMGRQSGSEMKWNKYGGGMRDGGARV